MGAILDQANALAELIANSECGAEFETVHPHPPAHVEAYSAVISPAPDWGDLDGASSFCDAEINWEIILIAPYSDFGVSLEWFYDRTGELASIDELAVRSWSQPEAINNGGTEMLAVRVQLYPMTIPV